MKKTVAFLLSLFVLLLILCSCSNSRGSSSERDVPPPAPAKKSFQTTPQKLSELPRAEESADSSLAAVSVSSDRWGYISKEGSFVIEPKYPEADSFSGGLATVAINDSEKGTVYGYLNADGEYAEHLYPDFSFASCFSTEGIALVRDKDSEYFYINKDGVLAFPERILPLDENYYEAFVNTFPFATDFQNGAAVVLENDPIKNKKHYLLISSAGKILYEFDRKYCDDDLFSVACALPDENGYCIVGVQDGEKVLFGVIERSGTVRIEPAYEEILPCSEGLFAVKKDGYWGYIDVSGNMVHDFAFDDALPFSGQSAPVKYHGKWGILNHDGAWLIEPYFDDVSSSGFCEGILAFEKDGKWGYLRENGEVLCGETFADADDFSQNAAFFRSDSGLWGALNSSGQVIIEPAYVSVKRFCSTES